MATSSQSTRITDRSWLMNTSVSPSRLPQFPDQQQNVGLGRDIEPGNDLIGDNEVRLQRQRPRDAGALPLAA